jgi:hypothetical protein
MNQCSLLPQGGGEQAPLEGTGMPFFSPLIFLFFCANNSGRVLEIWL